MPVHVPATVDAAVAALASNRDALVLAGGTDVMVEINDGRHRPGETVVVVNRIPELRAWRHNPTAATLTIGAAVTYRELMQPAIALFCPALADASRTVGSPQIRHAGTIGGNLGTCSPAGDALPVLAALDATIELAGPQGRRYVPIAEFMVGVKRTALAPGELIVSVTVPVVTGFQGYAKVGVRNAMVIAVATAITIALRTPTLAYPWNPVTTGTVTETISSPGANAVRLTPTMNSAIGTYRRPCGPASSIVASSAARTGNASPAGEHVPRLPPIVPA